MIILGLGFVVLALAQERAELVGLVSPLWLLLVYLLHTIGELCLSPIGLSMVTKLAPSRLVAVMMGVWFTAMAVASYLAGMLEQLIQHTGIPLYWFLVASSIGAGVSNGWAGMVQRTVSPSRSLYEGRAIGSSLTMTSPERICCCISLRDRCG